MSIILPTAVLDLIQPQGMLRTDIAVALRPTQLFRDTVVTREEWNARENEYQYFSRNGLLPVSAKPKAPGADPLPQNKAGVEQWYVTCNPYNESIDTSLPNSYNQIQNDVMRDARSIMIQAGTTLAHVVRNKLYNTYLGGNTVITATSSGVTLSVDSCAGFKETLDGSGPGGVGGRLNPVSPSNLIEITVGGITRFVSACSPTDPTLPDGPGSLTITVALACNAGDAVLSKKRPIVYRVGGGATTDAISSGNKITVSDFRKAVVLLRKNNLKPFPDGTFHAHIDPTTESQLQDDVEFQRALTGVPQLAEWRQFYIKEVAGITFFRNNECPQEGNITTEDFITGKTTNASGVEIHRPIVCGQGVMMEKYVPLDKLYAEGGNAPTGIATVSDFNIAQDQSVADLVMDGIKYIIRGPMDRLQEQVSQTWSYKGDFACPCDSLTGTAALYKRAIVVEHAG